jgi:hypothetical protein
MGSYGGANNTLKSNQPHERQPEITATNLRYSVSLLEPSKGKTTNLAAHWGRRPPLEPKYTAPLVGRSAHLAARRSTFRQAQGVQAV